MSSMPSKFNPLGRQQVPPIINAVVAVGPYSTGAGLGYEPDDSVTVVNVDTSGTSTLTITLPSTANVPDGRRVLIQDTGGNAAAKNITVNSGGGTIHGTTTISTNYGCLEYQSNGTDWYLCNSVTSGTPPAGSDTQVQINSSGAFGSSANFTYDSSDNFVAGDAGTAQLNVSGTNRRIHLNASLPVIGDTSGTFFIYNPNTSTYWSYTPNVLGALIPTDTGSGSLPT